MQAGQLSLSAHVGSGSMAEADLSVAPAELVIAEGANHAFRGPGQSTSRLRSAVFS